MHIATAVVLVALAWGCNGLDEPSGINIVFKDSVAKSACVEKFDTDGNGEVSVAEAEAATSFSGLFTKWKGVTTFDEIMYFKNVHSIDGLFDGCDKLVSITIPENITDLGTSAFSGCSSLTSVDLPSGITSVGEKTFYGVNMWKIKLPSTVTSLGSQSMGSITCVIVPSSSPVSIESDTFSGVTGVFVPFGMKEKYKAMTYWTDSSHKLHSLDQYQDKSDLMSSCKLGTSGAIDMGLSVKWAAYNVDATKPEEYGGYYAWGETETKSDYSWSTYKYCNGSKSTLTKYCNNSEYGTVDNKTVLEADDDVAHVKWGGAWRLPTAAEIIELRESCLWEWTTCEGVKGRMVYSFETLNKIFLPAAGFHHEGGLANVGYDGSFWSSSLNANYTYLAWYEYYSLGCAGKYDDYRYYGLSVRPVSD